MAIHPVYANAILAGEKQVEFRKRRLADDISTVLIYATSPVQKVLGEFRVRETVVDSPTSIWERYGHIGTIAHDDFRDYYSESPQAVAILVESVTRYARPRALSELQPKPTVPQSFTYLERTG